MNESLKKKILSLHAKNKALKDIAKEVRLQEADVQQCIDLHSEKKYQIICEVTVPAQLIYQVSATSPEEALKKINNMVYKNARTHLQKHIKRKATVYDQNKTVVKLVKNY